MTITISGCFSTPFPVVANSTWNWLLCVCVHPNCCPLSSCLGEGLAFEGWLQSEADADKGRFSYKLCCLVAILSRVRFYRWKRSFSKWGWNYRTYKKNISEKHLLRESLLHVAPSALFVGKYGWLSPNLIWELFLLGVVLAMAGTKSHSFSSCSMESPCSVGQYLQFLCWVQIELTIFC